jgi:serine phosphatase RsbU (regulator of sigma subunit)
LARGLTIESPVQVSLALMSGVRAFRGDGPRRDDETLVVLRRVIE